MKKYLVIGLIVAFVAGMVIVPLMRNKKNLGQDTPIPAVFTFRENLATQWNSVVPISIDVKSDDIQVLELIYNDSVLQTWNQPKGKLDFQLNAGYYGLGTKEIQLVSHFKNGEVLSDDRLVRVVSDVVPEVWTLSLLKTYPHNSSNFTQGFEWSDGKLYEATGDPGQQGATKVGVIDLNTGNFIKKMGLDANYFGEGITIFGDKIFQLTYTQGKCFVYDKNSLTLLRDMVYQGEGWGICNNGEHLFTSNGTERIQKRNPENFSILETIEVYDQNGPIGNINELEYVDGLIYANIWQTNDIFVIQPENGKVLAKIDASSLEPLGQNGGDVLNGIAYSPNSQTFFLTGKYWTKIFEVKFQKPAV